MPAIRYFDKVKVWIKCHIILRSVLTAKIKYFSKTHKYGGYSKNNSALPLVENTTRGPEALT